MVGQTAKKDSETTGPKQDDKIKIINRLKRLEGQVRGLQNMIQNDRECQEILTLLSGVRSALDATGDAILECYLQECQPELENGELDIKEVIKTVKLARG